MKKLLTLIALLLSILQIYAQTPIPNWGFAEQAGGSSYDEGESITIEESGNRYITGRFYGTATFGNYSLTSNGNRNIFVAKLDAGGNYLWATKTGHRN